MSRPAIQPFNAASASPSQKSLCLLEKRLKSAEEDTQQILSSLKDYGFLKKAGMPSIDGGGEGKGKVVDADVLQSNYEVLVSRVCRTESAIQTMKLALLSIHGDKALNKKNQLEVEERLIQAKQVFEADMGKLRRELESLREDLAAEQAAKVKASQEVKQLRVALTETQSEKTNLEVAGEDARMSRQRLTKRVSELKENLDRETSLRASLEESHNLLLGRIRDMETLVEAERQEVRTLAEAATTSRHEASCLREELAQERSQVSQLEKAYSNVLLDRDQLREQLEELRQDRQSAMVEVGHLKQQYDDLIHKLEQTQKLMDDQKNKAVEIEQENSRLRLTLQTVTEDREKLQTKHFKHVEEEQEKESARLTLEEEGIRLRAKVKDLSLGNQTLKQNVSSLESELEAARQAMQGKEEEFKVAAASLEKELSLLRQQLNSMDSEKQNVLQQKENLLEEVNQTVDSLMQERGRLQSELEQFRIENSTLVSTQRQLEQENVQLAERLASIEQQQEAQQKVEVTLKEMLEQKTKLAYENGRLQSQLALQQSELAAASRNSGDAAQLRKLCQGLQSKYGQSTKELSESKILTQRLEMQLRTAQDGLAQRDAELAATGSRLQEAEAELARLVSQIKLVEEREKSKVQSTQRNLDDAKTVNREIASTLEAVMSSHSQLQAIVENLQVELGRKDAQISQLKNHKNQEQETVRQELKSFESKMETMREELKRERDKSLKKTHRDMAEIKKQSDNLQTRNLELVRTNSELRRRVSEMESTISELERRLADQKHKTDYLHKAKRQLEDNLTKMKAFRKEIDELEQIRDEYMKKNQAQAETIEMFMGQIGSLQDELRELMTAQMNTSELLKQKEEALEKERRLREEARYKCADMKKHHELVSRHKQESEVKLKEIHNESMEISRHLQEAHEWFRSKFDKLQLELLASKERARKTQVKLEEENDAQRQQLEDERNKAQDAAQRAKEMIKASRETISRLADYAETVDQETKLQLADLQDSTGKRGSATAAMTSATAKMPMLVTQSSP